jgi:N-acetyltransferase 10
VCLEGEISKQTVLNSLSRGQQPSGDLIPWLISQQVLYLNFSISIAT